MIGGKAFGAAIMFLILCHELLFEEYVVQLLINYVQKSWHVVYGFVQELQDKVDDFNRGGLEFLIVHFSFLTLRVKALQSQTFKF